MSVISDLELMDLRSNYWGKTFNSAGARVLNIEKIIDNIKEGFIPSFESEIHTTAKTYKRFTWVISSDGKTYVSIKDVPSGVSIYNINYWVEWDFAYGNYGTKIAALQQSTGDEYSTTKTYSNGDYCIKDNTLYKYTATSRLS